MPEIITEERLYKAVPPLYSLTNDKHNAKLLKGKEFLFDKNEYYDMYHKIIAENVNVQDVYPTSKKRAEYINFTKRELYAWLKKNQMYSYHQTKYIIMVYYCYRN